MTIRTEKRLEIMASHQAEEFVNHARALAGNLEHAAKQVERWLKEGNLATLPHINSLGEVQAHGTRIDVMASRLCAIVDALELLKAEVEP